MDKRENIMSSEKPFLLFVGDTFSSYSLKHMLRGSFSNREDAELEGEKIINSQMNKWYQIVNIYDLSFFDHVVDVYAEGDLR